MSCRRYAVALILATFFLPSPGQEIHDSPVVSLVQLLASPEKFADKNLAVIGFLTIGQENNRLYLGKNDYDNALPNSIRVDLSPDVLKHKADLNLKYVRIVGIFHINHEARNAESVGSIGNISLCTFVSDPAHPFSEKLKDLLGHGSTTK